MEQGLRDCCRSIRIGKILIQSDEETQRAKVYYAKFPPDIYRRKVLLMYPILSKCLSFYVPFGPSEQGVKISKFQGLWLVFFLDLGDTGHLSGCARTRISQPAPARMQSNSFGQPVAVRKVEALRLDINLIFKILPWEKTQYFSHPLKRLFFVNIKLQK